MTPATADPGLSEAELLEAAALPEAAEVLYFEQRTLTDRETVDLVAAGSNVVTLEDGSDFTVTFERQVDPDGNRYAIFADIYQQSEDDPLVSELRIALLDVHTLSHDELVASWAEANPGASDEDVADFAAHRGTATELTDPTLTVEAAIDEWRETAADDETLDIVVQLAEQPPLDLPTAGPGLMDTDPAFVLDRMEARLLAIEDRKTEIDALQADLRARLEELGATITGRSWTVNLLRVAATPGAIDHLQSRDDLVSLTLEPVDEYLAVNRGAEIRQGSQIQQFLDEGYDGETPSGRNLEGDIFIGVIDTLLDIDHPAWKDCGLSPPPLECSGPRLTDQWVWDSGWTTTTVGTSGSDPHGTLVAGQLLADLTDSQDATITTDTERQARTGMTTESSFAAIDTLSGNNSDAMEFTISLGVDIANGSWGCGSCIVDCMQVHPRNLVANQLYHDGIFFVHAAGNNFHSGSSCTAVVPSTAAGTFSVGALDYTAADLFIGGMLGMSSRGGGGWGQPIIDLVTIGGRSGNGLTIYDDTYDTGSGAGTSLAAPVVAGAAANLKDQLVELRGSTVANSVGLLHAQMLLMGDGQLESGGKSFTGVGDELWGFGRMRMRMWDGAGMDTPWRLRLVSWTLSDREVVTASLNPDRFMINQAVPSAVDRFKAVVWWFEPNLNYAPHDPAQLKTQVCNEVSGICGPGTTTTPDAHRRSLGSEVAGTKRYLQVTGLDVPVNADPDDHYGDQDRSVFLAMYWEDSDRDDADGPDTGIQ